MDVLTEINGSKNLQHFNFQMGAGKQFDVFCLKPNYCTYRYSLKEPKNRKNVKNCMHFLSP